MQEIDKVVINFDGGQQILLNICLAFLMFSVALDLKPADFRSVIRDPRRVLVGLTSQLVLLPVLTLILIYLFKPAASIQMGMLLVSVCPGGNVSNYLVHRSEGNTALSITLTSFVTLFAVLVTPFSFVFLSRFLPQTAHDSIAISVGMDEMIRLLSLIILLPLALGMIINTKWVNLRNKIVKPSKILSVILLIGIIVGALVANVPVVRDYLGLIFVLVLTHNALALIMGYYFAKLNRLDFADCKAISIETGIQNSGLGLILIFNYFHDLGGMALVAAWWAVWHLVSGFVVSSFWSTKFRFQSDTGQ